MGWCCIEGWCCIKGSCRSWRKEIKEAASRKRAEELWRENKGKTEKLKQARINPGGVISDALVVLPRERWDRISNRPGSAEHTCFCGFVVLCRQRSCDEPMCCPQLYLKSYLPTYLLTYLLNYLLTPWSRIPLEKLTGLQLVKKFPAFYGTQKIITAFTSARHLSLTWARSIQYITPHPTSWRSILILSSYLRLRLPSGLFPPGFPTVTLYTPLPSPIRATCPLYLILLDFISRTIFGEQYRSQVTASVV
jgi:hypothetical protein